ncbi:hypothetical protein AU490_16080 [Lonsdalea populi]|uniref:Uncharacterized protein n=1 Tax=Lonsdalea populi TaxID=1172565 RepID=A0A3N0U7H0_9GAMM|nr:MULTISPECIES: hypothetical protein [Lonsdalea]RAT14983.1 hypothetical protein AU486_11465 [Lonsdalea quercina]RAT24969.1 hypothetical protein AU490_16080 [Lonsdalea populi]RAT33145.1 hypothetical protein AU491_11005 [Lonsdalea populi]RAT43877.1 hypothetical protein AU496_11890 [Lonsdalea populi]RAT50246.1 hypothetical protein AU498_13510 [Lonsdalea populi]
MELRELLGNMLRSELDSFGKDIDKTNEILFSEPDKEKKKEILFDWVKRFQPCMLGRLGAGKKQHINISVYVIDDNDVKKGDEYLHNYLQDCRHDWKRRSAKGESDAVLYFFNIKELATAAPSDLLVEAFEKLSNFIFHEYAPIHTDVIYTEAAPLEMDGKMFLYKAGINFFHTAAHLTANHDRRVPGGAIISINSVGHYANNLIRMGLFPDLETAVSHIQKLAWQSIGKGGFSAGGKDSSTSWHNIDPENTCPFHERPGNVPDNFSIKNYTAKYHTDILIPDRLTRSLSKIDDEKFEKWKWLTIEYFTAQQYELGCIDFGMFQGYRVDFEAIDFNPFPPIKAVNSPDLIY